MTSASNFALRFTRVDDLTRPDHPWLAAGDRCYFLAEYTARQGYSYSAINSLILNFKKSMERRGQPEWRYKERAILQAAEAFRQNLDPEALDRLTFVPVPPSKARDDPLHDDRLTRMLRAIRSEPPLDVRELIVQIRSAEASHGLDVRPRPQEIASLYRVDDNISDPAPQSIAVVDDMLTTGAHYRAAHSVLSARFPAARIIGLFIARRVPDSADVSDFDESGH